MAHAVTRLGIHNAQVVVWKQNETIGLTIPAPHCEGDCSEVTAFVTLATLRQLRDDINAVLGEVVEP